MDINRVLATYLSRSLVSSLLLRSSQLGAGAAEFSSRIRRLVSSQTSSSAPGGLSLREQRILLVIERQIDCLVPPLQFCVFWARKKHSAVQSTIHHAQEILLTVCAFIQPFLDGSFLDEDSSFLSSKPCTAGGSEGAYTLSASSRPHNRSVSLVSPPGSLPHGRGGGGGCGGGGGSARGGSGVALDGDASLRTRGGGGEGGGGGGGGTRGGEAMLVKPVEVRSGGSSFFMRGGGGRRPRSQLYEDLQYCSSELSVAYALLNTALNFIQSTQSSISSSPLFSPSSSSLFSHDGRLLHARPRDRDCAAAAFLRGEEPSSCLQGACWLRRPGLFPRASLASFSDDHSPCGLDHVLHDVSLRRRRRGTSERQRTTSFSLGSFLRASRKLHEARTALQRKEEEEEGREGGGSASRRRRRGKRGGDGEGGSAVGDLCMSVGRPYFRIITETLLPSSLVDTSIALNWWVKSRQHAGESAAFCGGEERSACASCCRCSKKYEQEQEESHRRCCCCAASGEGRDRRWRGEKEEEEEDREGLRRGGETRKRSSDDWIEEGEEGQGRDHVSDEQACPCGERRYTTRVFGASDKRDYWGLAESSGGLDSSSSCCSRVTHHASPWTHSTAQCPPPPGCCSCCPGWEGKDEEGPGGDMLFCSSCLPPCGRREEEEEGGEEGCRYAKGPWRGGRRGCMCRGVDEERYSRRDRRSLFHSFASCDRNMDLLDYPISSSASAPPSHVWVVSSVSDWKPLHGISMLRIVAQRKGKKSLCPLLSDLLPPSSPTTHYRHSSSSPPLAFSSSCSSSFLFSNQLSTFMCIEALKLKPPPQPSLSQGKKKKNRTGSGFNPRFQHHPQGVFLLPVSVRRERVGEDEEDKTDDYNGPEDYEEESECSGLFREEGRRGRGGGQGGGLLMSAMVRMDRSGMYSQEDDDEEEEDFSSFSYGFNVSMGMYQPNEEDQNTYDSEDVVLVPDPEKINETLLGGRGHDASSSPPLPLSSSTSPLADRQHHQRRRRRHAKGLHLATGGLASSSRSLSEVSSTSPTFPQRERRRPGPEGGGRHEGGGEGGGGREDQEREKYYDVEDEGERVSASPRELLLSSEGEEDTFFQPTSYNRRRSSGEEREGKNPPTKREDSLDPHPTSSGKNWSAVDSLSAHLGTSPNKNSEREFHSPSSLPSPPPPLPRGGASFSSFSSETCQEGVGDGRRSLQGAPQKFSSSTGERRGGGKGAGRGEGRRGRGDLGEPEESCGVGLRESFLSLFAPLRPSRRLPAYIPPTLAAGISCRRLNFPISVSLDARLSTHRLLGLPDPCLLASSSSSTSARRKKEEENNQKPQSLVRAPPSRRDGRRETQRGGGGGGLNERLLSFLTGDRESWSVGPEEKPGEGGRRRGGGGEEEAGEVRSSFLCRDWPVLVWSWMFPGGGGGGGGGGGVACVPLKMTGLLPQLKRRLSNIRRLQESLLDLLLVERGWRESSRPGRSPEYGICHRSFRAAGAGAHRCLGDPSRCRCCSGSCRRAEETEAVRRRRTERDSSSLLERGRRRGEGETERHSIREDKGGCSGEERGGRRRTSGGGGRGEEKRGVDRSDGEEEEEEKEKSEEEEGEDGFALTEDKGKKRSSSAFSTDFPDARACLTPGDKTEEEEAREEDKEEDAERSCEVADGGLDRRETKEGEGAHGDAANEEVPGKGTATSEAREVAGFLSSSLRDRNDGRRSSKEENRRGGGGRGPRGGGAEEEGGGLEEKGDVKGKKKKHTKEKKSSAHGGAGGSAGSSDHSKKDRLSRGGEGRKRERAGSGSASSGKKSKEAPRPSSPSSLSRRHTRSSVSAPLPTSLFSEDGEKSCGVEREESREVLHAKCSTSVSVAGTEEEEKKQRRKSGEASLSSASLLVRVGKRDESPLTPKLMEEEQGGGDASTVTTTTASSTSKKKSVQVSSTPAVDSANEERRRGRGDDSTGGEGSKELGEDKKLVDRTAASCRPGGGVGDASSVSAAQQSSSARSSPTSTALENSSTSPSSCRSPPSPPPSCAPPTAGASSSCSPPPVILMSSATTPGRCSCSSSSSSCCRDSPERHFSAAFLYPPTQSHSSPCRRERREGGGECLARRPREVRCAEPRCLCSASSCCSPSVGRMEGSESAKFFCQRRLGRRRGGAGREGCEEDEEGRCCCSSSSSSGPGFFSSGRDRERTSGGALSPRLLLEQMKQTGGGLVLGRGEGEALDGDALVEQRFIVHYAFQFDPDALHSDPQCIANGGTTNTRRHRRDGMSGNEDQLTGLDFLYLSRLCVLEGGGLFPSSGQHLDATNASDGHSREEEEEEAGGGATREEEGGREGGGVSGPPRAKTHRHGLSPASSANGLGSMVEPSDELLAELFKNVYLDEDEESEGALVCSEVDHDRRTFTASGRCGRGCAAL